MKQGIRLVSTIALLITSSVPFVGHGALTSTNYEVEGTSVGNTGSSMSSPNFSLTPQSGSVYGSSIPGNDSGNRYGTIIKTTLFPNMQDVISESITAPVPQESMRGIVQVPSTEEIDSVAQNSGIENQDNVEKKETSTSARTPNEYLEINSNKKGLSLLANLVSGDFKGFFGGLQDFAKSPAGIVSIVVTLCIGVGIGYRVYRQRKNNPFRIFLSEGINSIK